MSTQDPDEKKSSPSVPTTQAPVTPPTIQIVVPTEPVVTPAPPRVRSVTYMYIIAALIVVILLILSIFLIYIRPMYIGSPLVQPTGGIITPPPPAISAPPASTAPALSPTTDAGGTY